ncbi:putative inorganic phosphate cotransporter [Trichogramma pretiosum]|uniref:putative inorganic phosphate cotransporter n=1 Tax=Trichogramma pretiosum TaxID=7493 RepID=UPI000C71BBD9|nr:putative inorganic phosphate cotransporter [Trichogramma pretiosum]
MTSNTLLYKDKGPKCSEVPQIFMIFFAVLIFHQSFTTQNGLGITFMLKSWPYLLKTLSYVMLIVAAAVLATNWSAKNLLCLSIAGIGMLHLIQGILDQTIDPQSEQLNDFFKRLMSIAYGVTHAPVLPCVYVLLARLTPPQDRATFGSYVFSAKQCSTIIFLIVTTCCANDNSFLEVYYATYSIFGLIAVVWSIVYYFVGSNYDLEFVDQAPSFKPQIPWSSILSSLPVWTLIFSHASSFAVQVVTMKRSQYMFQNM